MTAVLRLALAAWLLASAAPALAGPATVAVASSLQFAFPALVERFRAQGGAPVRVNYGASGNFRRQIAQGAPFELFLSADEQSVLALHQAGHLADTGVVYAVGRLAWIQPAGRGALPSESAPSPPSRRPSPTIGRGGAPTGGAGQPGARPYGIAARQALEQAGLWAASAPLRVMGENVSQAARFALADEARGGLVAYSLALAPALGERAEHVLIPADRHAPLRQRMALVPDAGEAARALYAWLQGEEARAILARFGFQPPSPSPTPASGA